MKVYLADNQDITRAGLTYLLSGMDVKDTKYTEDKAELIAALRSDSKAVVVLDYTLFDINDANELSILCQRFPSTWWVLFSDDLSQDFIHQVALTCPTCGIVLKECDMAEIRGGPSLCADGQALYLPAGDGADAHAGEEAGGGASQPDEDGAGDTQGHCLGHDVA